jgi:hypothetical protein
MATNADDINDGKIDFEISLLKESSIFNENDLRDETSFVESTNDDQECYSPSTNNLINHDELNDHIYDPSDQYERNKVIANEITYSEDLADLDDNFNETNVCEETTEKNNGTWIDCSEIDYENSLIKKETNESDDKVDILEKTNDQSNHQQSDVSNEEVEINLKKESNIKEKDNDKNNVESMFNKAMGDVFSKAIDDVFQKFMKDDLKNSSHLEKEEYFSGKINKNPECSVLNDSGDSLSDNESKKVSSKDDVNIEITFMNENLPKKSFKDFQIDDTNDRLTRQFKTENNVKIERSELKNPINFDKSYFQGGDFTRSKNINFYQKIDTVKKQVFYSPSIIETSYDSKRFQEVKSKLKKHDCAGYSHDFVDKKVLHSVKNDKINSKIGFTRSIFDLNTATTTTKQTPAKNHSNEFICDYRNDRFFNKSINSSDPKITFEKRKNTKDLVYHPRAVNAFVKKNYVQLNNKAKVRSNDYSSLKKENKTDFNNDYLGKSKSFKLSDNESIEDAFKSQNYLTFTDKSFKMLNNYFQGF